MERPDGIPVGELLLPRGRRGDGPAPGDEVCGAAVDRWLVDAEAQPRPAGPDEWRDPGRVGEVSLAAAHDAQDPRRLRCPASDGNRLTADVQRPRVLASPRNRGHAGGGAHTLAGARVGNEECR